VLEKEQIYVHVVIGTTLNLDEKDFWLFFSIPANSFYNWLLLRSAFAGVAAYPQAEQTAIASSLSSQSSLPVKANLSFAKSSSSNP